MTLGAASSTRIARLGIATLSGYLVGTFPSADIAAHFAGGNRDLRTAGSRNPGATNALRVLGRRWGASVLVADVAKGAIACALGRRLGDEAGANAAGSAAVLGHCYPLWNRFQGGKGVATSAGQLLGSYPFAFPPTIVVAAGVAALRRETRAAAIAAGTTWTIVAAIDAFGARRRGRTDWLVRPVAAAISTATVVARIHPDFLASIRNRARLGAGPDRGR